VFGCHYGDLGSSDRFRAFFISVDQAADLRVFLCWSGSNLRGASAGRRTVMWSELGETVRKAMEGWPALWRFVVCVVVLTAAAAILLWMGAR
jgi:hypothetical protein